LAVSNALGRKGILELIGEVDCESGIARMRHDARWNGNVGKETLRKWLGVIQCSKLPDVTRLARRRRAQSVEREPAAGDDTGNYVCREDDYDRPREFLQSL
jgi:hypothetical protein